MSFKDINETHLSNLPIYNSFTSKLLSYWYKRNNTFAVALPQICAETKEAS